MKKHNLFKVVGITVLVAVLMTWIFKISYFSEGLKFDARSQVGLFEFFQYPMQSFRFFSSTFLFILIIGAFYAILNATGVYKRMLEGIVDAFNKREKLFLIITIVFLAVVSSVVGIDLGLIVVFPLLISIILLMGYSKLTAILTTVGSTIVGLFGATFSYNMVYVVNNVLGIKATDEIWAKIILLLLGIGVLIFFVLKKVEKEKGKDELLDELLTNDKKSKKSVWPLIVIVDLTIIVMILSTIGWNTIFGLKFFDNLYTAITNISIGGFKIFAKIFGAFGAFGTWSIDQYSILLIIASIILAIVYRIKFNDFVEAYGTGAKKNLFPAIITTLVYTVLIITVYNPTTLTVSNFILGLTKGFNIITSSITFIFGSIFNVDMYYYSQNVLQYITSVFTDTTLYPLIGLMFTSLYGLVMLIAPTSVILIFTLAFTKTSYKEWLKYIWKLFVILLIISLIVFVTILTI